MALSYQYTCPKCGSRLHITATYDSDETLGESIDLTATCKKCNDTRVGSLDETHFGQEIQAIASNVGHD